MSQLSHSVTYMACYKWKMYLLLLFFFFPQIFTGNSDPNEEALTVFDYPLFGRYFRIHPRGWINDIALRLEVLGCDTQQLP